MKAALLTGILVFTLPFLRADDLAMSAVPTQEFFILGEPVQFKIFISNHGATDSHFFFLQSPETITVSSEAAQDGVEMTTPPPGFGGLQVRTNLKPGDTWQKTYTLGDYCVEIHKSGTFHFDLGVDLDLVDKNGQQFHSQRLSAKLTLMVLPHDAKSLAAKIDALGETLIHDDVVHPSRDRLANIRLLLSYTDPRSVEVAGKVYEAAMPGDKIRMIELAEMNPDFGRSYLEKFATETSSRLPGVQERLRQALPNLNLEDAPR